MHFESHFTDGNMGGYLLWEWIVESINLNVIKIQKYNLKKDTHTHKRAHPHIHTPTVPTHTYIDRSEKLAFISSTNNCR